MRFYRIFILIGVFVLIPPGTAFAVPGELPGFVNVRNFGAIANDREDDTEAIVKAIEKAAELATGLKPSNGSYIFCAPAVFFPPGRYHVNRQIDVPGRIALCSNSGKAIIEWIDDPTVEDSRKESMFRIHAYTNTISNLKFIGGKTHLLFHNANTNQTLVEITGCEFQHATGIAVRAVPSGQAGHLSTQLTVRGCKFIFNYACLETYCDYATVIDTWVELRQPQMADGAAFINRHGHLFFDRMLGVPCADISKAPREGGKNLENARWVDNYGAFSAVSSRFGAEGGGIPVVYQFGELILKYPWISNGGRIDIKSCSVYTGSTRRKMGSVIVLHGLPRLVVYKDNVGPVNNPLFKVQEGCNLPGIVEKLKNGPQGKALKQLIKYQIDGNLTFPDIMESIPVVMREFIN